MSGTGAGRGKALVALVLVAAAIMVLAGCGAGAKPTAATQPSAAPTANPSQVLLGEWRAADTAGKSASLSDLTLSADGRFRYAGKNALGGPVAFGGTYQVGMVDGAQQIRLVYDDFPANPTLWFYKLEGSHLTVSTVQGNLTNGMALVFTRR
jgi:hypothetical protein